MTVLCPMWDPFEGFWYIIVHDANGNKKMQRITSRLMYYKDMKVKPPVGAKYSQQEQDDYAYELALQAEEENFLNDLAAQGETLPQLLPVTASTFFQAPQPSPIPSSPIDIYHLDIYDDPILLPPLNLQLFNSPLYDPSTPSKGAHSILSNVMKATMTDLSKNKNFQYDSPSKFSFSPYTDLSASPKKSFKIGSNSPPLSLAPSIPSIFLFPKSSGSKIKNSSMQPSTSSMSYSPQLSSGYKDKYNNVKLPSTPYFPQFSASSGYKYKYDSKNPMSSLLPKSDNFHSSTSTGTKPKGNYYSWPAPLSSYSYSSSDFYSQPSTSSGTSQKLPPISTLHPHTSSSAASSSSANENPLLPSTYEHPDVSNDMLVDELPDDTTFDEDHEMYEEDEEK